MSKLIIKPISPFDFDLTLGIYGGFRAQSVDLYSRGQFERVLSVEARNYLVTASSTGTVENPEVTVSASPPPAKKGAIEVLVEKMKWMMGADLDMTAFYEHAKKVDLILFQITQRLYGLKPPRTPTVFEALIIAITEQQTALAVASGLRGRLVKRYGESVHIKGERYYQFPTPESLAGANPKEIRKLGFSFRKALCMVEVAQKVKSGQIELEALKSTSLETILEKLIQVKGIGRWTVEYMMCRGMGRYDVLPANDAGLKAAVSKFYGTERRVTEGDVRRALEQIGEFGGHAALYLIFAYALEKYDLDPRVVRRQLELY